MKSSYTIENVEVWAAGQGFSCELRRNGKRVADCYKSDDESKVDLSWYSPEINQYDWTEERRFKAYLKTLPLVQRKHSDKPIKVDEDIFIKQLVECTVG